MAQCVCPWWLGYFMASPVRRLMQNPHRILASYIRPGMTVLEPGPGMGFFSLPAAELAGPQGRIVAIDVQSKMLAGLRRRAAKAGLSARIELRLAPQDSMDVADLAGSVDLVLAIAVVHELPSAGVFFREAAIALKPGGSLLLIEPTGHVKHGLWERELEAARAAGLKHVSSPIYRRVYAALLCKPA